MAGIKEVADAAGVSTATVSRALRGLPSVSETTRTRIVRLAHDLGYVPSSTAAGLRSGRTMAMSVVVPHVKSWFYSSVIEGVDSELRRAGYDLVLFNLGGAVGERERLFHSSILRKRGDALLALCIDFTPDERDQLVSIGLPSMIVGGPVHDLRYVGIDEVDAARLATQHLIELGHRDILFVGGGAEEAAGLNASVPTERRRGYERAARAAGLPPASIRSIDGEFSTDVTRTRLNEFLDTVDTPPTAVFAASDEMALGAMLAGCDHGLSVPADMSVIGIDDHPLAAAFGLTTVAQHPFAQGATAARLLLNELEGGPARRRTVKLPTELIVRSSTAAPPVRRRRAPSPRAARGHRSDLDPTTSLHTAGALASIARPPHRRSPLAADRSRETPVPIVGVVAPSTDGWFNARAIEGIETALLGAGRDMALYVIGTPTARQLVFGGPLLDADLEGVIAVGLTSDADDADALLNLGHPVIAVGSPIDGMRAVSIDQEAAARFATEHLLSLGHTDIAHLAGAGASRYPDSVPGLRLRGFQSAMSAAGIDPTNREWAGQMSMPGGYSVGRRLLGDPRKRPTAIFAACDEMAFGAIVAAREFGISIPNELSVIGIDGHEAAEMFSLTTLCQDPSEQGRAATALLLRQAEGEKDPPPDRSTFRLVVGSSTTAPRSPGR
jgi:LacI family repressor for deo operon, udp, cdd, tsx, nupC, and nupG